MDDGAAQTAAGLPRTPPPAAPVLEVRALAKQFPGARALDGVSLAFRAGEVHGIIGENGAGKSTLMKILAGVYRPSEGEVLRYGTPVALDHPSEAARLGIAMVHQELNLVGELSVADNIFLGRERTRLGLLRRHASERAARELLQAVGADLPPHRLVRMLPIAQQQMVEIAKALGLDARVLILDEPTAVLSEPEVHQLFALIRRLTQRGVTVLYISHLLPEVLAICDRISVLRDGQLVTTLDRADLPDGSPAEAGQVRGMGVSPMCRTAVSAVPNAGETYGAQQSSDAGGTPVGRTGKMPVPRIARNPAAEAKLGSLMVGRPMGDHFPPRRPIAPDAPVRLEVRGLSAASAVRDVSFRVRAGEIVGLAGLVGAGRTETAEALFGLRRRDGGEIRLDGRPVAPRTPQDAMRCGLAYVTEDRKGKGLLLERSIAENLTLAALRRFGRTFIRRRLERSAVREEVQRLSIKAASIDQPVGTLSGGNQQKVCLGKWLRTEPQVLLLDEPTRGIDIGAKEEVYRLIARLAAAGMACVVISSELNELLGLCHRINVMRHGRLMAELEGPAMTEENVMFHAAGVSEAST